MRARTRFLKDFCLVIWCSSAGQQLGVQHVQVDLVAQAGRVCLQGAGGVVAAAVEAPVD
jgi:hypothetical protein